MTNIDTGRAAMFAAGVLWGALAIAASIVVTPLLGLAMLALAALVVVREIRRGNLGFGLVLGGAALSPAIALWIFVAVTFKPYRIPSEGMRPTLQPGDRVFARALNGPPRIGDIVVFRAPAGADGETWGARHAPDQACPVAAPGLLDAQFVQRVVAGPGDRVAIVDGQVVRNGERQDEPYAAPCTAEDEICRLPREITVPPDAWFVLGDNRGASDDSRFFGPVPRAAIDHRVVLRYFPPKRIGRP